jgi:Fe2+ or Zn2+ uptake regulation protein
MSTLKSILKKHGICTECGEFIELRLADLNDAQTHCDCKLPSKTSSDLTKFQRMQLEVFKLKLEVSALKLEYQPKK